MQKLRILPLYNIDGDIVGYVTPKNDEPKNGALTISYGMPFPETMFKERNYRVKPCYQNFYDFCRSKSPDFYTTEKNYLKTICDKLQLLIEMKLINQATGKPFQKIILALPPGTGKLRLHKDFNEWYDLIDNSDEILNFYSPGVKVPGTSKLFKNQIWPYGNDKGFNLRHCRGLTGRGYKILFTSDLINNRQELETYLDHKKDYFSFYTNALLPRIKTDGFEIILTTFWDEGDLPCTIKSKDYEHNYYILKFSIDSLVGDIPGLDCRLIENIKNKLPEKLFYTQYRQLFGF